MSVGQEMRTVSSDVSFFLDNLAKLLFIRHNVYKDEEKVTGLA